MLKHEDYRGLIHGLPESEHLRPAVERLAMALDGGKRHSEDSPEWIAFQTLYEQSLDRLEVFLEPTHIDTILERLDAIGWESERAAFEEGPTISEGAFQEGQKALQGHRALE